MVGEAVKISAEHKGKITLQCRGHSDLPHTSTTREVTHSESIDPAYNAAYLSGDAATMDEVRRYPAQVVNCPECGSEMAP